MVQIPLPKRVSASGPPPKPDSGQFIARAIAYGMMNFFLASFFAVLVTAALSLRGRDPVLSMTIGDRLIHLGLALGLASGLCRLIGRPETDQLISFRPLAGDSGILGFFFGLFLVGYIATLEKLWTPVESLHITFRAIDRLVTPRQPDEGPTLAPATPIRVAGTTVEGGSFDSAEHLGKVVLIDFWATSCRPCVAEIPNLKAVHEEFHGQGLVMAAVSLDTDADALKAFVAAHGLPWPQLLPAEEAGRGFDNPIARQYSVHSIPKIMLIGPDGRLRHANLRGQQVRWAVAAGVGAPTRMPAALQLCDWFLYAILLAPKAWLVFIPTCLAVAVAGVEAYIRFRHEQAKTGVILRREPGALGS